MARRYTGGSRGVSFRIAKGVSYRVGGYRGYSTPVRDFVVAAVGNLIVSNQRLIFQGDNQSFSAAWEKVMNYVNEDGFLKVTIDNRAKPRLLEFLGDYQPVEVMLAYAQKHRFISEAPAGKSAERIERPSAAATTAKSQPQ